VFIGVDADEGEEDGESGGPGEVLACRVLVLNKDSEEGTEAGATEEQKAIKRS
jgi:hypothetical protein